MREGRSESQGQHGLKHLSRRENGPVLKSGSRGDALWTLR